MGSAGMTPVPGTLLATAMDFAAYVVAYWMAPDQERRNTKTHIEMENLKKNLSDRDEELNSVTRSKAAKEREVERLTRDLQAARSDLAKAKSALEKKEKAYKDHEEELKTAEDEIDELKKLLNVAKSMRKKS